MNHCVMPQNRFTARDEVRSSVSDRISPVVCPKPRRVGLLNSAVNDHPVKPLRWQLSHQMELCESKAGTDLLDIILSKGGGYGVEQANHTQTQTPSSASPPFFCGSPPSRVANPLIHDSRFGDETFSPFTPPPRPSSPAPSARKGGCVRANFGNSPAVRIEGFDCLDRDSRNCSIPALA